MGLALGALLAAAAGCSPKYPNCNSDDNCKDKGEVCVQGQCRECATDANCKEGFVCDGNRCVPRGCASDADCGPGKKCEASQCVDPTCTSDADCPNGRCVNNRCQAGARRACTITDDCASGEECQAGFCGPKSSADCSLDPIRFEFNKFNLSSEAERQLSQVADCLKKSKNRITLEGHADDRGTEEFNMQLSNRRAASVKRYLSDLGVSGKSLDTVGYGESRPLSSGSDEAAWTQNRRVEFKER
ncbi:MAG TPA: OmpA family protein [Myxococcaceae bacterium]|nr:OmpA family protein [Myxococcaceae bacterium]